jgi:hypothetical protein
MEWRVEAFSDCGCCYRRFGLRRKLPVDAQANVALHVLAYNLTRVMNIMGVQPLLAAMRA